ncbi:MAG: ATP-binding cassette domain-containing protein, partial [Bacteroidales bacterium]|nr:ATP-binding cassette domain-containing protein [Bacteroidales bacterium]
QPLAKQNNYTSAFFSFNAPGGRCEACQGEGNIKIEMQFMADVVIQCDQCHGKRFKDDILEVKYRDKNIYDILDMTVNQAIEFFSQGTGATEKKIVQRLKPLQDVGIGYIKMGQSSSTLSGGENQRVKLASYLADANQPPTLFIFDEPTTGLHFHDINKLLTAFNSLIEKGHTLVIIEHNMDVIKSADWLIDLGPDGGDNGGRIVFQGTPDDAAQRPDSKTGLFLKKYLSQNPS